jgi:hypothetical protein
LHEKILPDDEQQTYEQGAADIEGYGIRETLYWLAVFRAKAAQARRELDYLKASIEKAYIIEAGGDPRNVANNEPDRQREYTLVLRDSELYQRLEYNYQTFQLAADLLKGRRDALQYEMQWALYSKDNEQGADNG